jgi:hypothetical protein
MMSRNFPDSFLNQSTYIMEPLKILVVATSHTQLNNSLRKTGLWLEEIAVPYYIFKEAGASITLASPKGDFSKPLLRFFYCFIQ